MEDELDEESDEFKWIFEMKDDDKKRIFIHYIKKWFLLDFISAFPFYIIFALKESECIGENIYYDSKLNNSGKHSFNYNTNP